MRNYDPGERSAKSLINAIDSVGTPDWALEEGGTPFSEIEAEMLAYVPAPVIELEIPISIENVKTQPLNEKEATELLFSELHWGQKGIEVIDIIDTLQGSKDMVSLSEIHAELKNLQDTGVISSEHNIDHQSLHDFLASALYCGLLGHCEKRISGQAFSDEGYFVPRISNNEMFLSLAKTCYEVENLAPKVDSKVEFFLDSVMKSPWPVSIEEYLGRIAKNTQHYLGSSLTAMCGAIWPTANQLQLLRLEALTRCAIATGVVKTTQADNVDYKFLELTPEGVELYSRFQR